MAKAKAKANSGLGNMDSTPAYPKGDQITLFKACGENSVDKLQQLISKNCGFDVNFAYHLIHDGLDGSGPDVITAAGIAAQLGHDKCLVILSQCPGIDLAKAPNLRGMAPIHYACKYGRTVAIGILLDNGVEVNIPMEFGHTPVMICCSYGHVQTLDILLCSRGVDVNLKNIDGFTAAHFACRFGYVKCLQLLKKRGADINSNQNIAEITPLDFARIFKKEECIAFLIKQGAIGIMQEELLEEGQSADPDLRRASEELEILKVCLSLLIMCYMSIFILLSSPVVLSLSLLLPEISPEKDLRNHQRHEDFAEASQTVRVPGVRGECERHDPTQMCRVQGLAVLRQKARHTAQARTRELLR